MLGHPLVGKSMIFIRGSGITYLFVSFKKYLYRFLVFSGNGNSIFRGLFPDTKEERLKSGVEEITVPFTDLLCQLETVLPTPDHHAYLQQQSWPFDTVFPKLSLDLKTTSRRLVQ